MKIFAEHDFPIQSSYTGQVQCLSQARDQKSCDIISARCYLLSKCKFHNN